MALLYADENFHLRVVEELRPLGHDVLTAQQAGQANQKILDPHDAAIRADCRFVERILTVVQTCRVHGKNTLEYLCQAVHTHPRGLSCPSLLSR